MASEFLNPKQILSQYLRIDKKMLAADFGCGSGNWAVLLAEILEEGKVYAIDLLDEPLSALRSRVRARNVINLEIIKSDLEKKISRLLSNSLDLVLMINLLFQIKDRKAVLEEAKRVLKPGGKILVIDWKSDAPGRPDTTITPDEIKKLISKQDFSISKEFSAGNFHYGMILEK